MPPFFKAWFQIRVPSNTRLQATRFATLRERLKRTVGRLDTATFSVPMSTLQKIYTYNLVVALVICAALTLWLILIFSAMIQPNTGISFLVLLLILALFLPLNLFLKFRNRHRELEVPAFMPKKLVAILPILAMLIFLSVMAYGLFVYPATPIKLDGSVFTDKVGNEYTLSQFQGFQRWEAAYITTWTIVALQFIVNLPFFDNKTRKWFW